jgi:hypothetical protein
VHKHESSSVQSFSLIRCFLLERTKNLARASIANNVYRFIFTRKEKKEVIPSNSKRTKYKSGISKIGAPKHAHKPAEVKELVSTSSFLRWVALVSVEIFRYSLQLSNKAKILENNKNREINWGYTNEHALTKSQNHTCNQAIFSRKTSKRLFVTSSLTNRSLINHIRIFLEKYVCHAPLKHSSFKDDALLHIDSMPVSNKFSRY